jgi:hypothetical protein
VVLAIFGHRICRGSEGGYENFLRAAKTMRIDGRKPVLDQLIKNLHGIHEPSMKIRAPIKSLKQHSSMLSGDKGQKISSALKQLDTSVTDLHSASDEGNQADAETALKGVESALDQLKAQDPETAFKNMH